MTQIQNPYSNLRVEFHVLQSFPVTCLNRDDVGAPKTAMVGGSTRARVSSQCWKRQVRLSLHDMGIQIGVRTKLVSALIAKECSELGATPEQAKQCAETAASYFGIIDNGANDTLMFITKAESKAVAQAFAKVGWATDKPDKESMKKMSKEEKAEAKKSQIQVEKVMKEAVNLAVDGLDVALFGRMVASAPIMNVEAAASFSHAISTHKVTNEVEFFTALDDHPDAPVGSAHMGSLEFNSATYYRYVSLDIGQLWESLGGQNIPESVEAFTKALFVAVPSARQTTQSGASPWEYAKIYVRKGQRLQVPFETAVRAKDGGFLEPSKAALTEYLDKKEKLAGSLFGKKDCFTFGEDENFNIDKLVDSIKSSIARC